MNFPVPVLPLTEHDYTALASCWITKQIADEAGLHRVISIDGAALVGRNGHGSYSGVVFPYVFPGSPEPREFRLRRDQPDIEIRSDGSRKEIAKYLCPSGSRSLLYVPPGVETALLTDTTLPLAITEGEKKALALFRLANHESLSLRFLPVAIAGVYNWRGTVGIEGGPKGERISVKGTIRDLDRLSYKSRTVYLIFDNDVLTNWSVRHSRARLARLLRKWGARVLFVNVPAIDRARASMTGSGSMVPSRCCVHLKTLQPASL